MSNASLRMPAMSAATISPGERGVVAAQGLSSLPRALRMRPATVESSASLLS